MKTVSNLQRHPATSHSLQGQLLVAMPLMRDRRFRRSVIYMCAHSESGAMGLIVNKLAERITYEELLQQLKIDDDGEMDVDRPIYVGGPVSTERGFVLHTDDYFTKDSSIAVNDGVCLTATVDVLRAIARRRGPRRSLLALGCSSWGPGQLEREIQANGWLHCAADGDLVFGEDLEDKYDSALAKLGINPAHLVGEAGHA
ncbi:MAG: YqgE/AlgH family protein [Hyphomicrobiaceae bacterium]